MIWGQLVGVGSVRADPHDVVGHGLSDGELALCSTGFQDILSTPCFVHDIIHDMAQYIISQEIPKEKWYFPGPKPPIEDLFQQWPLMIPVKNLSLSSKTIKHFPQRVELHWSKQ